MDETPSFWIWPKDFEEGDDLPDDFYSRLYAVLSAAGYECEPA